MQDPRGQALELGLSPQGHRQPAPPDDTQCYSLPPLKGVRLH